MQVSSSANVQSAIAMKMLQQAQQQQVQMAQTTIQMSQAQQSVQNGQQILGSGALVDMYV